MRLRTRSLGQRHLIRRVIRDLAGQRSGRESFGRVVRLVHATAVTALPVDADGELAERRLLRLCEARLGASRHGSRVAA